MTNWNNLGPSRTPEIQIGSGEPVSGVWGDSGDWVLLDASSSADYQSFTNTTYETKTAYAERPRPLPLGFGDVTNIDAVGFQWSARLGTTNENGTAYARPRNVPELEVSQAGEQNGSVHSQIEPIETLLNAGVDEGNNPAFEARVDGYTGYFANLTVRLFGRVK